MTAMKAAEEYLKPYSLSYRDPSDRDSYSSYREGYSDAMDIAGQVIEQAQKDAYNEAWEHAIALRKRTGNPYNEREGKAMLDFEIEARKLKR